MSKFKRIALSTLLLSLAVPACALPGMVATPGPEAIGTFIARTMTAAAAQTASAKPSASPTAIPPSQTFTPSLTLTATSTVTPFFTATPIVPLISVSVATNCRSGPGKVYGLEGALLVGETTEVLARDPTGKYWYIRNPDSAGDFCWVWGQYATLTGNASVLPVFTPPPTPTPTSTPTPAPNFEAAFVELDNCSGDWWVEIRLTNTGSLAFRSMGLTVKDKDTDVVLTKYTNGFTNSDGCLTTTTKDIIEPGNSFVVSSSAFTYNIEDHNLRATVILCTNTGQSGTCITRIINFKP